MTGGGTLIEDLPAGFAAGVLFNMQDDPRHHHIRRLVTPSVSPKQLRAIEAALAERCAAILDAALDAGTATSSSTSPPSSRSRRSPRCSACPQEDRHFLLDWADATLDYEDHDPGADLGAAPRRRARPWPPTRSRLLDEKRRCPADDILSIVANAELPDDAEPGGPMTELEQQMFFHLLVAAGSETTRNSITAGMLALMERPERVGARCAPTASLLPTAVEEMLRWASSTIYNRRTATADVERHGQLIRPGDKVVLWWQSANFDERAFADPHRVRHPAEPEPAPELRRRQPLLPGRQPGPPRDPRWCSTACSIASSRSSPPVPSSAPGRTSTPASATPRCASGRATTLTAGCPVPRLRARWRVRAQGDTVVTSLSRVTSTRSTAIEPSAGGPMSRARVRIGP